MWNNLLQQSVEVKHHQTQKYFCVANIDIWYSHSRAISHYVILWNFGDCIRQNKRICPRHENNPELQCTNVTIFSDLSHAYLRKKYHLYFIHGTNVPKEVTFFPNYATFLCKTSNEHQISVNHGMMIFQIFAHCVGTSCQSVELGSCLTYSCMMLYSTTHYLAINLHWCFNVVEFNSLGIANPY